MVTAFETPDDVPPSLPSWEDNTRLLALERPRETISPRSLAYFVGMFPDADYIPPPTDHDFPNRENARARQAVVDWMRSRLTSLWPGAAKGSDFDWSLLEAPEREWGDSARLSVLASEHQSLGPLRAFDAGHAALPDPARRVGSRESLSCRRLGQVGLERRMRRSSGYCRPYGRTIHHRGKHHDHRRRKFEPAAISFSALPLLQVLRKLKDHTAGGAGQMDAYCVTILAVKKDVQAMLPPGLSLMSTDLDTDLERPVVLLFTRQSHVRPGFVAFGGINYHEFIEIIPNVCRDDLDAPGGGPFSYMPYLVLDQFLPVLLGVNLYGYNKRLGRIANKAEVSTSSAIWARSGPGSNLRSAGRHRRQRRSAHRLRPGRTPADIDQFDRDLDLFPSGLLPRYCGVPAHRRLRRHHRPVHTKWRDAAQIRAVGDSLVRVFDPLDAHPPAGGRSIEAQRRPF